MLTDELDLHLMEHLLLGRSFASPEQKSQASFPVFAWNRLHPFTVIPVTIKKWTQVSVV